MAARRPSYGYITVSSIIGFAVGVLASTGTSTEHSLAISVSVGTMLGLVAGVALEHKVARSAKPIQVVFRFRFQIHDALPQYVCWIELFGDWTPELSHPGSFQDIFSWSNDKRYLALVKLQRESSGDRQFCIFVIDVDNRTVVATRPTTGHCHSLWWHRDRFAYHAIAMNSGTVDLDDTSPVSETQKNQMNEKHPLDD